MGNRIAWFDIPVNDLERASNFYRQVLGVNIELYGGEVLQAPHSIGPHGHRAIVRDSDGNRIVLHSDLFISV